MLELVVEGARPQFAIGLGTASSFALSKRRGLVCQIPSRVAWLESRGRSELVIGNAARDLLSSGSPDVRGVAPMRGGSIANFRYTRALLAELIGSLQLSQAFGPPSGIMGVSPRSSDVERVALREAATAMGVDHLFLFWEPILAALGVGLPVEEPRAIMTVDIGAGATTVTVISLGGVIAHAATPVGSDSLDERVMNYVRSSHGVAIERSTAQTLRTALGLKANPSTETSLTVTGYKPSINSNSEVTLSEKDLNRALTRNVEEIAQVVRDVYEHLPPEVALDVSDHGGILVGGTSESGELDVLLQELTELPMISCESPGTAVMDGAQIALDNWESIGRYALPQDY